MHRRRTRLSLVPTGMGGPNHGLKSKEMPMRLRRSQFIHEIPLDEGRALLIHAVSHLRLVVDQTVAKIVRFCATPRELPADFPALIQLTGLPEKELVDGLTSLLLEGILTQQDAEAELADIAGVLSTSHGRDPAALVERFRREAKRGPDPYWATGAAQGLEDLNRQRPRVDLILFGDCDVHMEADFLRKEASRRGIDLHVAATFPDDLGFVNEHKHDAILIGALRSRHQLVGPAPDPDIPAYAPYISEANHLIKSLRFFSSAPILIDNLPEPTLSPLGMAERGIDGHRNRFRLANVALSQQVEDYADVHVVDVAAALNAAGAERLIDDSQVGYSHFGSPGWMLQRADSEKAAVHNLFPDIAPLAQLVDGDPYIREGLMARVHMDALSVALGLDRKKCVILDLDGVMWPGVLAETGSPFAWRPDVSGQFSYIGLYFGLHEALLSLKKRGILLACVSKNDEETVRALWTYPEDYPTKRLLTPDDFVTWRVNWNDKVDNISSIAEELGFALSSFLFIDDHPVERDRVRQRLPEVEVWGEDPFALRRRLLTDPRLMTPRLTDEASGRTELVKTQLVRQQVKASLSETDYLASLNVTSRLERLTPADDLQRIEEIFQRTTQFNTTGRKFSLGELQALAAAPANALFAFYVSDRFGDHGLVGTAVVEGNDITGLALSCRVLGMGAETEFLNGLIDSLGADRQSLTGRIIETDRNLRVRHIYRDHGFTPGEGGVWRRDLAGG